MTDYKALYEAEVKRRVELESEIECRHSTWETKEGEYETEIAELKSEIDAVKEKQEQSEEVLQELGYTYQEGMGYVHRDD